MISFHGLTIKVIAPDCLLDALSDRFACLGSSEGARADITFEYAVVPELYPAAHPERCRSFYDSLKGRALYDPLLDKCYLETGEGIQAFCAPLEGSCRIQVVEPLPEKLWLLTHPFVTLPLMEMLKRRERYMIHAAGVARRGRSILICGASGAGKTTLTVALVRAGFDYMGDDLTVLMKGDEGIRALAFPEVMDVTESSATFFPELAQLAAQPRPFGWLKHPLKMGDYYPSAIAWETVPAAVLFPRITDARRSRLMPMSSTAALLGLSASVLLTEKTSTGAHLDILGELTRTVPCYEFFTGSDFEKIPHLLESLLMPQT